MEGSILFEMAQRGVHSIRMFHLGLVLIKKRALSIGMFSFRFEGTQKKGT